MKISVISDSHVPKRADKIPEWVKDNCLESDKVVHAGDITSETQFHRLDGLYDDFTAVKGNCDTFNLPESTRFSAGQTKIGVYHGSGIKPRGDHETLTQHVGPKIGCNILIHGHTHKQETAKTDGYLLVNPGSCTGVGGGTAQSSKPKMTELEVTGSEVTAIEIVSDKKTKQKSYEM